jgi:hypothetical protein
MEGPVAKGTQVAPSENVAEDTYREISLYAPSGSSSSRRRHGAFAQVLKKRTALTQSRLTHAASAEKTPTNPPTR